VTTRRIEVTERSWRLEVSAACVGSGMCIATAPGYFHLVDGHSEPVVADVAQDDEVIAAAELCPMVAITVRERDSGRIVSP
jgi:ferredoxin